MKSIILYATIIALFSSCDPGFGINLVNNSDKKHTITYIESPKIKLNSVDSLYSTDTASTHATKHAKWISVHSNTISNTYILTLEPGRKVTLKHGIGRIQIKNLDQKIVIDDVDTILLGSDKRVKISPSSNFMSTEVLITVR